MKTNLRAIKHYELCLTGWRTLLKHLGKTEADDAPISLLTILESNGFDDALWCLRAVEGFEREKRLFAVFCAKQVSHLMKDKRSLEALEVAKRYANDLATDEELKEASDAASWAASAASDASAARAAIRTGQEKEFVRMLNCIENCEVYTI